MRVLMTTRRCPAAPPRNFTALAASWPRPIREHRPGKPGRLAGPWMLDRETARAGLATRRERRFPRRTACRPSLRMRPGRISKSKRWSSIALACAHGLSRQARLGVGAPMAQKKKDSGLPERPTPPLMVLEIPVCRQARKGARPRTLQSCRHSSTATLDNIPYRSRYAFAVVDAVRLVANGLRNPGASADRGRLKGATKSSPSRLRSYRTWRPWPLGSGN